MESSICASLYAITGKEMSNSPNTMTGQLNTNGFSQNLTLEGSPRHHAHLSACLEWEVR